MASVDKRTLTEEGQISLAILLQVRLFDFPHFRLPLNWLDKFSILSNITSVVYSLISLILE